MVFCFFDILEIEFFQIHTNSSIPFGIENNMMGYPYYSTHNANQQCALVNNSPATLWPCAPRISQNHRPIGDCVFGPFPEVAHPLHEKSAKDGALCKRDKKRTGNLSVSGFSGSLRRI